MALVRWDPARELDTLQSDMNRLFDSFFGRREGPRNGYAPQRWVPAMDLVETGDHLILRADLPGVDGDDISIEVKDGVLTVAGERRAEHEEKGEGFHRIERAFGRFSRALDLPQGISPDEVEASFDRGVLEVRIPKPEERKPTKIEIQSGAQQGTEHREPAAAGAGDEGS